MKEIFFFSFQVLYERKRWKNWPTMEEPKPILAHFFGSIKGESLQGFLSFQNSKLI